MQLKVNNNVVFELSEIEQRIIQHDVHKDDFIEDMQRRCLFAPSSKLNDCRKRLEAQWLPILAARYDAIPTDKNALAELIFSQEDYKCRATRDAEVERQKKKEETK